MSQIKLESDMAGAEVSVDVDSNYAPTGLAVTYQGTRRRAPLASTFVPSGDVSGLSDTAAFQALLNQGGEIRPMAGTYYFTGKLTAPVSVKIVGVGSSDAYWVDGATAATRFLWNTSTSDGLELQGAGSVVEDVHFGNTSSTLAVSGAALVLNGCHGVGLHRCSSLGWFDSVRVDNCVPYLLLANKFSGPARGCVYIDNSSNNDEGDPAIIGNWMTATGQNNATPTAAIIFKRGGGVKITGNKINREKPALANTYWFTNAIRFNPSSGATTGVFPIIGNSLENMTSNAILMDATGSGSGSLQNIVITGNELQGTSNGAILEISGSATYSFNNISIGENVATGFGGYISAKAYCDGLNIGRVQADSFTGQAIFLGQTGGIGQATATVKNVSFDVNDISLRTWSSPKPLVIDYTASATDSHARGSQVRSFSRDIPNLGAAVPTTTSVARLRVDQYQSVRVKVTVSGNFSGVGAYTAIAERVLTVSAGNVITATTVGTDFNTGSAIVTIGFNVSTNNVCDIQLTTNAGLGLTASQPGGGQITVEIFGRCREVARL